MKEAYLKEALNQMKDLKRQVNSIDSLLERAYDKKKKWCSHCQMLIIETETTYVRDVVLN